MGKGVDVTVAVVHPPSLRERNAQMIRVPIERALLSARNTISNASWPWQLRQNSTSGASFSPHELGANSNEKKTKRAMPPQAGPVVDRALCNAILIPL
jgi:hypothetical protein